MAWCLTSGRRCLAHEGPPAHPSFDWAVMTATLCGLGGVRAVIAEHLLLKQQLIVVRRPRQRAPRLTASDRLLFGFGALFLSPGRIRKVAIGVRLSVSNSLSGRHWELDQVPAVGDPTDIVQLGSGAVQRCLNLGFSERIGNSRRTGDRSQPVRSRAAHAV